MNRSLLLAKIKHLKHAHSELRESLDKLGACIEADVKELFAPWTVVGTYFDGTESRPEWLVKVRVQDEGTILVYDFVGNSIEECFLSFRKIVDRGRFQNPDA